MPGTITTIELNTDYLIRVRTFSYEDYYKLDNTAFYRLHNRPISDDRLEHEKQMEKL